MRPEVIRAKLQSFPTAGGKRGRGRKTSEGDGRCLLTGSRKGKVMLWCERERRKETAMDILPVKNSGFFDGLQKKGKEGSWL